MMKRGVNIALGCSSVILLVAVGSEALAYVGSDPVTPQSCTLTRATAEFGPDGSIRYDVMGTCSGFPINGQMAYATNQEMRESFYYGGVQISTKAICPADPWTTGVQCQDQKVYAKDGNPGPLLYSRVPLSLYAVGSAQGFQNARANAAHPKPPGPPINAKALMRRSVSTVQHATISWLGPDQQGNYGPYLNFVVEARPQRAEGAAWIRLGGLPRHAAPDYQLIVQLPPVPQGIEGWELRTCSTTIFTSTCTGPIVPISASFTERDLRISDNLRAASPPRNVRETQALQLPSAMAGSSQRSPALEKTAANPALLPPKSIPGVTQQNQSAGQSAALNPQPLPPKTLPGSIQSIPSAGTTSALNPQPLPPKALNQQLLAPKAFSAPIRRRGVPQEDSTSAETKPTP
jgi:hypothetical protein